MDYAKPGCADLDVSRICLDRMSDGNQGNHAWSLGGKDLVNLLYREAEGNGVIPRSPRTQGKLRRAWDYTSLRTELDEAMARRITNSEEVDRKVDDRLGELAKARDLPRAQIALPWLLAKPAITAPIVGATKLNHLDDALGSVDEWPSADEIAAPEESYVPRAVAGSA